MVDALSQIDRPDIYRIRQPRQLATFPPLSHSSDYFAIESVREGSWKVFGENCDINYEQRS